MEFVMGKSQELIENILSGYKEGKTVDQLAKEVGESTGYVANTLLRKGVDYKDSKTGKDLNEGKKSKS